MVCDYSQIMTFENNRIFALSAEIAAIKKDALSKMPLHINVIAISAVGKLKETAHSLILQKLLKHQDILNSFIENIIGLKGYEVNPNEVNPAEQNRIDVSIFSKDICIIIENKVNGAVEQQGQIYRYVHCAKKKYSDNKIYVLYLNPRDYTRPSDYSLTEYGEGNKSIPASIKNNIIVKNYTHDIYEWIREVYYIIPDNELFLKSAIHQYQDYLEEYFELTDKFKPMNERIKTVISNNLLNGLSDENDADFSQRIEKLEEAYSNLTDLQKGISELTKTLKEKRYKRVVESIRNELSLPLKNLKPLGFFDYDYGVEVCINGKTGHLGFGYNYINDQASSYIGFAFDKSSLTEDEYHCLIDIFSQLGNENSAPDDFWPCWSYIEYADLPQKFLNFVMKIKRLSEVDKNCKLSFVNL